MTSHRPTQVLTALLAGGALVIALQADTAFGVPVPKPRPASAPAKTGAKPSETAAAPRAATPSARFAVAASETISSADLASLKEAVSVARRGKTTQAEELQKTITDPVARKLVEWVILRSDGTNSIDLRRYMAFINDNPSWPAVGLLRRRAEATLWADRLDPAFVRSFFAKERPTTTKGKFALARALLLQGDRAGAQSLVREAWRNDEFSDDLEGLALDVFQGLITPADHKARMDMRLYAEDTEGGLRSANRAGGNAPVIARARIAVINKAANAKALLDAAPAEAHRDIGYIFSRAQFLRRADKAAEAAELILSVPNDPSQAIDLDQWWIERRLVARKLLDLDEDKTAYRVARDAVIPSKDNYRAEHQFTAGWIALRFLNDPATALAHFAKVGQGNHNPITLARAGYWQGRAAEAMGRRDEARAHYEAAARYSTAYYGQIARARLGHKDLVLRPPPEPAPDRARLEVARAIELLYAIDERDLIAGSLADLGERSSDAVGTRGNRRGRRPSKGRTRHGAVGQVGARARTPARTLCLSDLRHSRLSADRTDDRTGRGLRHRPPGEHLQPANGIERARHGPDAGHARGRPLRDQEVRGNV